MSKREIAFDTETTGFEPSEGHRIIEIGCVEMVNRIATGKTYHAYINPERDVPQAAFDVHGLSREFLSDKPKFSEVADNFISFVGDATLVIHNAQFDMKFINHHLKELEKDIIPMKQSFCTLQEARRRFPGSPASLDALCKRFEVDNSSRTKHGALLDAELLADMYLELMGGSQVAFELGSSAGGNIKNIMPSNREKIPPREHLPSEEELAAHTEFLKKINQPAWQQ